MFLSVGGELVACFVLDPEGWLITMSMHPMPPLVAGDRSVSMDSVCVGRVARVFTSCVLEPCRMIYEPASTFTALTAKACESDAFGGMTARLSLWPLISKNGITVGTLAYCGLTALKSTPRSSLSTVMPVERYARRDRPNDWPPRSRGPDAAKS